jgi:hypothetical protein
LLVLLITVIVLILSLQLHQLLRAFFEGTFYCFWKSIESVNACSVNQ